ncbi:DUF1016 N-terminal domain-containing protein [Arthrobacter sp. A5]|uniref:DUF1016 N-terminal domain-containing protein n=1 Tax=Arthrobacter sp. A5 TaxID=576926 RepID=UPI003DAA1CF2
MRTFSASWDADTIGQAPLAQLPWYHHIALMQNVDDPATRLWYASRTLAEGWSRNVLVHQIDTRLHERAGKATSNFPVGTGPGVCLRRPAGAPCHRWGRILR